MDTSDKIVPLTASQEIKEQAVADIASATDVSEIKKLVAELKVMLLADIGYKGGLSAENRTRAWKLAAEIGKLLLRDEP